jgi:hypothetical protein
VKDSETLRRLEYAEVRKPKYLMKVRVCPNKDSGHLTPEVCYIRGIRFDDPDVCVISKYVSGGPPPLELRCHWLVEVCNICERPWEEHADGKCLFSPSYWTEVDPVIPPYF